MMVGIAAIALAAMIKFRDIVLFDKKVGSPAERIMFSAEVIDRYGHRKLFHDKMK